jgi:hypothetical protein
MNPPPIGEALGFGWEKFKQDPVPVLLAVLVAGLITAIPIVGIGLGMPGALYAGLKVARGQKPEIGDALIGFQKPMDYIMIGLLQMVGVIACCVGVLVTAPLFYQGYFLILEKGKTWQEAKDICLQQLKPNWMGWAIFWLVMSIVAELGVIACGVGILATVPIVMIALAQAYELTLAKQS